MFRLVRHFTSCSRRMPGGLCDPEAVHSSSVLFCPDNRHKEDPRPQLTVVGNLDFFYLKRNTHIDVPDKLTVGLDLIVAQSVTDWSRRHSKWIFNRRQTVSR